MTEGRMYKCSVSRTGYLCTITSETFIAALGLPSSFRLASIASQLPLVELGFSKAQ